MVRNARLNLRKDREGTGQRSSKVGCMTINFKVAESARRVQPASHFAKSDQECRYALVGPGRQGGRARGTPHHD
jgi:hypothetical protein